VHFLISRFRCELVLKSCTSLQFRLPFDLNWLLNQQFASSPKFKRALIEYAASGACDLKNATLIVLSLSPNYSIETSLVKTLLCFFFENDPVDHESLQNALIPMIRQNLSNQTNFGFLTQPLRSFQKFNHAREYPRPDFSAFVDFLEQLPAFQLCLKSNLCIQEAFCLALICNADFSRANYLVLSFKLSALCIETFLSRFANRNTLDTTIALFSSLDMEAKIRVIRTNSRYPSVSQALINSIAPAESIHRSASLEDTMVKTLQKITQRKDSKAAIEFLKKVSVESDECSNDVIIVSHECFSQLLQSTLSCVAKSGDIYVAGKIFVFDHVCKNIISILQTQYFKNS